MKKLAIRHQWLFGRIELGLSKTEFNALTPADFKVAVELWADKQKRIRDREDELIGRLAYFINLSTVPRKSGDRLPSISDFMPYKKRQPLTERELRKKFERVFK